MTQLTRRSYSEVEEYRITNYMRSRVNAKNFHIGHTSSIQQPYILVKI